MSQATDTTPILSIQDLSLVRGRSQILQAVNWHIHQGEQWAILGANGCGKTSLLSAITAYLSPSSGRIELLGNTYGRSNWNVVRQHIGIVSSALARRVPADESALETVLSGATAQIGFWTRDEKVDDQHALACMEQLGIVALAQRQWAILSQGERQKVFIARALMADPTLLILDEPCAGLDPVARENFLTSLRSLAQAKKAISQILVTHHIEEIFPEMTHVLVLKDGRVLRAGVKREVLTADILSQAFGAQLEVREHSDGRYTLSMR